MNLRVFYLTRRGISDGYVQNPEEYNPVTFGSFCNDKKKSLIEGEFRIKRPSLREIFAKFLPQ